MTMEIAALASGSSGNCYLVNDGSSRLLLECGISIRHIREGLGFGLSAVAGCLVSHEHDDHCKALAEVMRASVDCYMSPGTAKALGVAGHRLKYINHQQQLRIGSWRVLAFSTQHDAAAPLGFVLASDAGEKAVYATDTYYLKYTFPGLTHILIETNYSVEILNENVNAGSISRDRCTRITSSHFELQNALDWLAANDLSKVQEIWLLHLSNQNSDAADFSRKVRELTGKPVYVAGEDAKGD